MLRRENTTVPALTTTWTLLMIFYSLPVTNEGRVLFWARRVWVCLSVPQILPTYFKYRPQRFNSAGGGGSGGGRLGLLCLVLQVFFLEVRFTVIIIYVNNSIRKSSGIFTETWSLCSNFSMNCYKTNCGKGSTDTKSILPHNLHEIP